MVSFGSIGKDLGYELVISPREKASSVYGEVVQIVPLALDRTSEDLQLHAVEVHQHAVFIHRLPIHFDGRNIVAVIVTERLNAGYQQT